MNQVKFANPKLQGFTVATKPRTTRSLLISIFLEVVALVVVGLTLYFTYVLISNFMEAGGRLPPSSMPYRRTSNSSQLLVMLLTFLGVVVVAVVIPLRRLAKRYRINAQGKLIKDGRDPVLYLRSFDEDYVQSIERRDKKTSEELLVSVLKDIGPIVAIGKPGEDEQDIVGATRIYLKDENWQTNVDYLMSISQIVAIHANISEGLKWEIQKARENLGPEKLLISFLSWEELDEATRQRLYESFKRHAEEILRCSMPDDLGRASFLCFEPDWTCKLIEVSKVQKLLYGGISFFPRRESSSVGLKTSAGAIRESLRPTFEKRNLRLGVLENDIEIFKLCLIVFICITLIGYYPNIFFGLLAGFSAMAFYVYLGKRAAKDETVTLDIKPTDPRPRKNGSQDRNRDDK